MGVAKAKENFGKVINEIFLAEQALSIYQNIGESAFRLNNSKHREIFGLIQKQAFSSLILSLGKLFERPNRRYPNYSIPTILNHLRDDFDNIPVNSASTLKLAEYLTDDSDEQIRLIQDDNKIKDRIMKDFEEKCPQIPCRRDYPLDVTYSAVRVLRDKRVAHTEDHNLDDLDRANWNEIESLLAYCESFINIINYGLFGSSSKGFVAPEELDLKNKSGGIAIKSIISKINKV